MKNLIKIFVLVLISTSTVLGYNTPTEGSTLQVLAPSGLKLRAQPFSSASVITIMPHGSEVKLLEFEDGNSITRVDWVDGQWIKIDFEGQIGWAFDGFLTILNVPAHDLEKCYGDLELLYPVEFWSRANFNTKSIDTLTDEQAFVQTTYHMINDQQLTIMERDLSSRLDLYLSDVRVMEVYQILESMIHSKNAKNVFKESSIFIEKEGTIKKVKINTDSEIEIREIYDGRVRVTIYTYSGC